MRERYPAMARRVCVRNIQFQSTFNLHIARVMDLVPKDERTRPRAHHNLDEIAWNPVPRDKPATLDYFMCD